MHCQQGGEVCAWNGLLDAFRRFWGGFEPFPGSVAHRSDRSGSLVWPVRVLALFICWAPVWPVVVTGLTGQRWADAAALFFIKWFACIGSGGACMCVGGALCGFRALVWCFALFAWVLFCLGCVEPLPLPKGVRDLSSSSDLALCLCLAFDCFLEFLFILFFSFSFLSCY
jgi:hypothetical protein